MSDPRFSKAVHDDDEPTYRLAGPLDWVKRKVDQPFFHQPLPQEPPIGTERCVVHPQFPAVAMRAGEPRCEVCMRSLQQQQEGDLPVHTWPAGQGPQHLRPVEFSDPVMRERFRQTSWDLGNPWRL